MYCMHTFSILILEIKATKHEVFDLSSTKNELCGEIHHYKQSLKLMEESLLGR